MLWNLHKLPIHRRMPESEGGRSELAGHTRIHLSIVVRRVSIRLYVQLESLHGLGAHDQRQPFVVHNMLDLRNDNLSCFVEHDLIGPMAIQFAQNLSHSIVLADENRMHSGQRNDLVRTAVTW